MQAKPLYELSDAYRRVLEAMYDASDDDGVLPDDLVEILRVLEGSLTDKVDNCCRVFRDLEATAKALKAEEVRFATRRKSVEKQAEWMEAYIKTALEVAHLDKLEAGVFKVKIRTNPEKCEITSLELVPSDYDTIPERSVSIAEIKKALQAGTEVPGACLTRGTRLEIK